MKRRNTFLLFFPLFVLLFSHVWVNAQTFTVNHPIDFNNGQAGVMFDLVNLSGNELEITQFTPSLDAGTWMIQVYVTTAAATWQGNQINPGAWTLAGQQTVTSVGVNPGTPVPGFNITLAPGQSRGIYITSTSGFPMNYTGIGGGTSRSFDDGVLRVSSSPGGGVPYPFGSTFISRAYNGGVTYKYKCAASGPLTITCPTSVSVISTNPSCQGTIPDYTAQALVSGTGCATSTVVQTPPQGTIVNPGTVTIKLTVTDSNSGNTANCMFNVTVSGSCGN